MFTKGTFAATSYTRLGTSSVEGNSPLFPQRKNQIVSFEIKLFEKISYPSNNLLYEQS